MKKLYILIFIIFLNIPSFSNNSEVLDITNHKNIYNLQDILWQFKIYEKDIKTEQDLIDALNSEWRDDNSIFIKLPHNWTSKKGLKDYLKDKYLFSEQDINKVIKLQNKIGIYRLKLNFTENIPNRSFAILISRIDNTDVAYFNGIEIGRTGKILEKINKKNLYYDLRRVYEIPSNIIKQGENYLTVIVRGYYTVAHGSGLFEGPFLFGNFRDILKVIATRDYIEISLVIIFIILFIYYLVLFSYQNSQFDFLFFSILSLFSAIYFFLINQIKYDLFDINNFIILKGVEFGSLFILFAIWLHFIVFLLTNRIWNKLTIMIDIYTIIAILYLIITRSTILWNRFNFYVNMFVEFFIIIYTVFIIIKNALNKSTEARLLIIGLIILIATVINDILIAQDFIKAERVATFGFTIFVVQIAFVLGHRYQQLFKETIKSNKNLKLLYDASIRMSEHSSIKENNIELLTELMIDLACKFVDAKQGSLLLLNEDKKTWKVQAIFNGDKELKGKTIEIKEGSPSHWVLLNKKSIMVPDINNSIFFNKNNKYETDSFIVFPLIVKNRIFGCVNITSKINNDFFSEADLNLLNAFAAAASITLENAILNQKIIEKERLEKEMEIACKIQTAILPKNFNSTNFEISGIMIPAEEVGGDYFDYIKHNDKEWFCIGDVTGHGITAGLIMMMTQSIINVLIKSNLKTPKEIISILNKALYDNINNRLQEKDYITLSIFCYYNENKKILFSGLHLDFFVYRKKDNKIERVETQGLWSGMIEDVSDILENLELSLESGDVILLFTDGTIEAINKNNELYGYERLAQVFYKNINNKCEDIIKFIIEDIRNFYYIQKDDITILCIRKR